MVRVGERIASLEVALSAQWSPSPLLGARKPQSSELGFKGLRVEPAVDENGDSVDGEGSGDWDGDLFHAVKGDQANHELSVLVLVRLGVDGPASDIVDIEVILPAEPGRSWSSVTIRKADGNMV